jgi:hypothetical protein
MRKISHGHGQRRRTPRAKNSSPHFMACIRQQVESGLLGMEGVKTSCTLQAKETGGQPKKMNQRL